MYPGSPVVGVAPSPDYEKSPLNRRIEDAGAATIDAAMKVHRVLGPGLLESAYQACLMYELDRLGLSVREEVPLPVTYESVKLDVGYRMDIIVEDSIVVEVKAVDELSPAHEAQLLTYLKLGGYRLGYLINFNGERLIDGLKRRIL